MLGKVLYLLLHCVSLVFLQPAGATAHSLKEIDQLFEEEAIPAELVELTKELEVTAGAKSIREEVHARQHDILQQYIRARTERKCAEALADISRLDGEIIDLRERGLVENEQAQRKERDNKAAFIGKNCSPTSLDR
jgi:hypothetical protein